uniref:Uncharacterized protein n=1 Tax=Ditylenchus dipsaci TaxID=166011 RepID=A0A915E0S7_9BILA
MNQICKPEPQQPSAPSRAAARCQAPSDERGASSSSSTIASPNTIGKRRHSPTPPTTQPYPSSKKTKVGELNNTTTLVHTLPNNQLNKSSNGVLTTHTSSTLITNCATVAVGPAVPPSTTLQEISKAADKCCVTTGSEAPAPVPCAGAPAVVVASQPSTSSALTPKPVHLTLRLCAAAAHKLRRLAEHNPRTLRKLGITCLKIQGSSESASDGQVIRLPECPAPVSPPTVVAKPPAAAVVQPKMDPREMVGGYPAYPPQRTPQPAGFAGPTVPNRSTPPQNNTPPLALHKWL